MAVNVADTPIACHLSHLFLVVQVLDVGRCSSLWGLPSSLLHMSQLERLVVPSMAIAQVGSLPTEGPCCCIAQCVVLLPGTSNSC
jgi:hypothetical protein